MAWSRLTRPGDRGVRPLGGVYPFRHLKSSVTLADIGCLRYRLFLPIVIATCRKCQNEVCSMLLYDGGRKERKVQGQIKGAHAKTIVRCEREC